MKTICIYHSRDLDGWCSAAIVKKKFPDAELIGWDYGMDEPSIGNPEDTELGIVFPKDSHVILVDVSFSPMKMKEFREKLKMHFIWIDHHKSTIQDSVDGNYQGMAGMRGIEYAACELTWGYFFPDKDIPHAVKYLGMYDSFRHINETPEIQRKVMEFQYAARAFITGPEDCWILFKMDCDRRKEWFDVGAGIMQYLKTEAKQIVKKAFPVEIDDCRFLMLNRERFNPANFDIDYHGDGFDGFGCFWFDGLVWTFSLYNANGEVDVSEVAKKFGGGGHTGAAGFTTKDISEFFELQPERGNVAGPLD